MGFNPEIAIPKNQKINEQWVQKNYDNVKKMLQHFLLYPDCFLDLIIPKDTVFKLFFYQRIALRAMIRYRYVYIDAPRAFSKSYLSILAGYLRCMFLPGEKFFICAPSKGQSAKIAKEKIKEIWTIFPFLKKELIKANMGNDYVNLLFRNGSTFEVAGALQTTRGERKNAGIIDEVRDHDGQMISEVILPLMNVDRKTALGYLDPTEPNQGQYYITSAGTKGTYAYERLIELFVQSIVNPVSTFVMGCTYRVPQVHGLLNKSYIEDLKLSSSYKEGSFAREYLSLWTGGADESWIDYDRISRYRKIVNPVTARTGREPDGVFYYISVDVARVGVLTSCHVIKVTPRDMAFYKNFIYSVSFHDMHFAQQSIEIKRLIERYKPREIIIDGTGLGVGLLDFMVMEQMDETGKIYPPYASYNNEDYRNFPGEKIINVLKANSKINSQIHTNFYNQILNGHCRFLINEQEAKMKLISTKKGAKMSSGEKLLRLTPYMETSRLMDEVCNLRIKNVTGDTVVEQINKRINKDRFSSAEYGLWGIKEIEEKYYKKKRSKQTQLNKFIMFTRGERH